MADVDCLTTSDRIRAVEPRFLEENDTFTDAVVTQACSDVVDPLIKGRLASAGFSTDSFETGSDVGDMIELCAAYLTASHLLRSYPIKHIAGRVERADQLYEMGTELLDGIAGGKYSATETQSEAGSKIIKSSSPETRHAQSVFVSMKSENWVDTDDERASS